MHPSSVSAARALLVKLNAPARLLRHVELVAEAADLILGRLSELGVPVRDDVVRLGVMLHDAGKIIHPAELERSGGRHENAGEKLLLQHGVSPELAHICVSHAEWSGDSISLEELLVALADKLWKGARTPQLEERVIDVVANRLSRNRWEIFVELDSLFENIAAGGSTRLERSRV